MILKVVFFGDNVPKDRADKAMQAAKECDAFLVLGSSVMTMSAFRLVRCTYFHSNLLSFPMNSVSYLFLYIKSDGKHYEQKEQQKT